MNKNDIIDMAREAGISIRGHYDETGSTPQELQRFYERAVAAEREACAELCELWNTTPGSKLAAAIRVRSNNT